MSIKMSNETYDKIKVFGRYILPAVAALYFAIAKIWGLPYGAEIEGTIAALVTFLNTILWVSSKSYEGDGVLSVDADGNAVEALDFVANNLTGLGDKKTVTFKIESKGEEND